MLGLYVHIPYCKSICYYCDFPKRVFLDYDKYIDHLEKEYDKYNLTYDTVYIGGGTPSSLPIESVKRLISFLPDAKEFTFECNPNDISTELLEAIKSKVTRISLGVQTFDNQKLKEIGRTHTEEDINKSIELIKKYDFDLNIDMMYGLPNQSVKSVNDDLVKLIDIHPDHISYYSLILEEKSVFGKRQYKNALNLLTQEEDSALYLLVREHLKKNRYIHYEISNFCLEGKESLHNLKYWSNQEYIGIGMGAASYYSDSRYQNDLTVNGYYKGVLSTETITDTDKMFYHLMLGFRLVNGVSVSNFTKMFGKSMFEVYPNLNDLINDLLIIEDDIIKPTEKGLLLNNEIMLHLMED